MSILCYHAIHPDWPAPLAVDPDAFAAHCDWLARRRTVLPLHEALSRLDRFGRLPRRLTALTFDDGFGDLLPNATPVLRRCGLPATVFLVAQTLTAEGSDVTWVDGPLPTPAPTTLTLEQVQEMQEAGMRFESHSFAHLDLTRLGFRECVRDLADSRDLLESLLGHPVRLLAYPRGRHNAAVRAAASRAGYTHAFTLPETREPVGPFSIPRVGVYRGNGLTSLRIKSARGYLRRRTGPAFQVAQRVRRPGGCRGEHAAGA